MKGTKQNGGKKGKNIFNHSTRSEKMAESASHFIGSWGFIIFQTFFILLWILANVAMWMYGWDPFPFIFLNLMLNIISSFSAPLILMSQNHDADRDRNRAINDLSTDRRVERKVDILLEKVGDLEKKMKK